MNEGSSSEKNMKMSAPEFDALYLAHCYATCSQELGFVSLNALVFHISFLAKLQPSEQKTHEEEEPSEDVGTFILFAFVWY